MRSKSFAFTVYFAIISAASCFAIAMRSAACFYDLNYMTGYFSDNSLINAADRTILFTAIFALSYFFVEPKGKRLVFDFSSPLNYAFAGALSLALLFFSKRSFAICLNYLSLIKGNDGTFLYNPTYDRLIAFLGFALGVLSLLSVMHFIFGTLVTKENHERRADFGLIAVITLALYAAYLYFNRDLPINSPSKIIDETAYIAAALFFLFETRISIGRERWRAYRAFGLLAMMLTAYSSVPSLVVYLADGITVSHSLEESILSFALFLFICARLILTAMLKENKEARIASLIKTAFTARQFEISGECAGEYDAKTDADLQDITLEDKGEYYELDFSASEEEKEEGKENGNEENTGD